MRSHCECPSYIYNVQYRRLTTLNYLKALGLSSSRCRRLVLVIDTGVSSVYLDTTLLYVDVHESALLGLEHVHCIILVSRRGARESRQLSDTPNYKCVCAEWTPERSSCIYLGRCLWICLARLGCLV